MYKSYLNIQNFQKLINLLINLTEKKREGFKILKRRNYNFKRRREFYIS